MVKSFGPSMGPFPVCPRDYDRSQGLIEGLPPFPRLPRVCQSHMSRVHCPVMLAPVYPVADPLRLFVRCAGNQYLVLSSPVVCHQRITCPSGYHTACPAFLGDLIRSHPDPPLNDAFRVEKSDRRHHPTMCNNGSFVRALSDIQDRRAATGDPELINRAAPVPVDRLFRWWLIPHHHRKLSWQTDDHCRMAIPLPKGRPTRTCPPPQHIHWNATQRQNTPHGLRGS